MHVASVGFSPIKGTRHLAHDGIEVDASGVLGDRELCVVDPDGRRVLRTVQHPSLVAVTAVLDGGDVSVSLPTGETVRGTPERTDETIVCDYWGRPAELTLLSGPHATVLSDYLGRRVRLAQAPRRAIVYGAGLTIITTASLAAVAARLGVASLADGRFRASIVLDTEEPFAEERWQGRMLQVGAVRIRVGAPVPRCSVVDIGPRSGVRDLPVFKQLVTDRPKAETGEPWFGVYAEAVKPGAVRRGDAAIVLDPEA